MADQGASSGGSKRAGSEFVKFSRQSAQRIAKVVRTVEAGDRAHEGIVFDHPIPSQGAAIRSATFTGAWSIGSVKNITFKYREGTANAHNDLINLPEASSRNCIVGKEGTAWRLINWEWYIAHAATAASLTTSKLTFFTLPAGAVATQSTVTFYVSVASCTTSTAS